MGDFPHSEMLNDIRDIMTLAIRDPPRKKINNFWQTFVNRNGNVVTLHRESERSPAVRKHRSESYVIPM